MSNLDLLYDLDILLMAAGEPDLKTLAAQGDGAIALCLAALEGRIFAGREVVRIGTRDGQPVYAVEILDPQVQEEFEVGLTPTEAFLKLLHQEKTARHEAGHAVAAVILGKQFRYVTIGFAVLSDGRRTFGHMAWVPKGSFCPELDSEKRTRFICERSAIIHFAGPIAGARFLGRKRWGEGCTHDLDWAAKMINHISGTRNESRANRKRLREQAEKLVSDHWIAIEAVACELLAKPRLSYQEVRRIMRKGKETSYA